MQSANKGKIKQPFFVGSTTPARPHRPQPGQNPPTSSFCGQTLVLLRTHPVYFVPPTDTISSATTTTEPQLQKQTMNTLTDCLKYLNIEGVVPATSPSSPLRGYEQKLTGVDFATPESVPLSDGGGDGFSWGDDMYASESGAESDDSASSIELQPHAPALEQAQQRPPQHRHHGRRRSASTVKKEWARASEAVFDWKGRLQVGALGSRRGRDCQQL